MEMNNKIYDLRFAIYAPAVKAGAQIQLGRVNRISQIINQKC